MLKRMAQCVVAVVAINVIATAWPSTHAKSIPHLIRNTHISDPPQPDQSCTVVYASDGELALGGNNEDYIDPLTKIWFVPGEEGQYGRVYVGFENFFPQGGMNDHGLFFDGLGVSTVHVAQGDKEPYSGNLMDKAMTNCATVDCVVALFERYHTGDIWGGQLLIGDSQGNSAIIEPTTILYKEGSFQVATNFYQSINPEQKETDWRYQTATSLLQEADQLSLDLVRDVMDAVHLSGSSPTLYTTIYDLKQQIVYLYYFHNYETVVTFDLKEELKQDPHHYDIPTLFPPNRQADSWARLPLRKYAQFMQENLMEAYDPTTWDIYEGTYVLPADMGEPGKTFTLVREGETLRMRYSDGSWCQCQLFPRAEGRFFSVTFRPENYKIGIEIVFTADETGAITHLTYYENGQPKDTVPKLETATSTPTLPLTSTTAAVSTATSEAAPPEQEARFNYWWVGLIGLALIMLVIGRFITRK